MGIGSSVEMFSQKGGLVWHRRRFRCIWRQVCNLYTPSVADGGTRMRLISDFVIAK